MPVVYVAHSSLLILTLITYYSIRMLWWNKCLPWLPKWHDIVIPFWIVSVCTIVALCVLSIRLAYCVSTCRLFRLKTNKRFSFHESTAAGIIWIGRVTCCLKMTWSKSTCNHWTCRERLEPVPPRSLQLGTFLLQNSNRLINQLYPFSADLRPPPHPTAFFFFLFFSKIVFFFLSGWFLRFCNWDFWKV